MISFLYFMKTFSLIFGSIAAACNAFVLVLVFALKNSTVGPYRILLIFYLALNLFVSIVTCIFSPIMSIDENFFLVVGPGVVGHKIVCTIGSYCMVAFCFTLVGLILVLSLSYIYRYVTICCQHRLRIFTEYQGLCIIGIVCFFFFAGFMGCSLMWMMPSQEKNRLFASHFSDHFGLADIESVSYMGAVAFTNDRLETDFAVMIGIRLACLFIPIGVIVYCGACIFLSLREQFSMVSHSSMATKYQSKLFALLLLQTLGPIILLYIPLTAIFVFSLARYKNFFLCDLISISIALSQLLDPIIVLFCVSDYRRAASSLVGLFSPYKVSTSGSKTVPSPAYLDKMVSFLVFMKVFSLVVGSVAAALNGFVLILVFALKNTTVGPYRVLLMCYLTMNAFCSIVISVDENAFIIYGPGAPLGVQVLGSYCMVAFCFTIIGLVLVLCVSYVYRYIAICCPHRLNIFSEFRGLGIIAVVVFFFFSGFTGCSMMWMMPSQEKNFKFAYHFADHFGPVEMDKISYMGAVSYNNGHLESDFAVMFTIRLTCLVIPMAAILCCGIRIILNLRDQFSMVSSHSTVATKHQYKLFVLLLFQTLGPILSLYFPLSITYASSLLRYKNFFMCDLISVSITLSQFLDPLIVLFCVSDYRRAASRLVKKVSSYKSSSVGSIGSEPLSTHAVNVQVKTSREEPTTPPPN